MHLPRILGVLPLAFTLLPACDVSTPDGSPVIDDGELQIESTIPSAGSDGVNRAERFEVVFSDEVDPSSLELTLIPEASLQLTYAVPSNRRFTYEPVELLAAHTAYVLGVKATSAAGVQLSAPYEIHFTTGRDPRLDSELPPRISPRPANGSTGVSVDSRLQLQFSKPMDRASVERSLSVDQGAECAALEWSDDDTSLDCVFGEPLTPGTTFSIRIEASAHAANGPALDEAFVSSFTTRARPRVVSVSPEDGSIEPSTDGTVKLVFEPSTNMDEAAIEAAFRYVSPAGHAVASVSCFYESCTVRSDVPFGERELVSWELSAAAMDRHGMTLAEKVSASFTTARRASVVLSADPALDGTVTSGDTVDAAGPTLTVGRSEQDSLRSVLSFDLGALPSSMLAFSSAALRVQHLSTAGTPADLGLLLVYGVSYGSSLGEDAFDSPVNTYSTCNLLFQCSSEAYDAGLISGPSSIWEAQVTSHVQRDLQAQSSLSQFRIEFVDDAVSGTADNRVFSSANGATPPELEVGYWEP